MRSILGSSPNYATKAIEASYIAVGHTDCEADIRSLAGFIPVAEYGQRSPVAPEEIGACEDVRYVLSPELTAFADGGGNKGSTVSTSGTKSDVYPIMSFGREAFASVPLKGKRAVTPMVLNPGTPSKSDPLGQRGFVSWKTFLVAVILNENWMARLETAVTDL